jgi:metal-responsive CopG/Arc/MetJ family transcriptional regulator
MPEPSPHRVIVKTSVSLPEPLLEAAKSAYLAKGYTSLSAYLQDLLRKDIDRGTTLTEPTSELGILKAQVAHLTRLVEDRLPLAAEPAVQYKAGKGSPPALSANNPAA